VTDERFSMLDSIKDSVLIGKLSSKWNMAVLTAADKGVLAMVNF